MLTRGASSGFGILPAVRHSGVLTTITVTIGGRLTQVNGVLAVILRLFQQTVWPSSKTRLAKSQIQSIIAQFLGVLQSIMSINPHTATLPHPVALENVMRDRSAVDVYAVPPAYVNTYRPVPQAGNIAPQERNLTDMDDAMAQDNLMMLKEADQAQDLQLQLANQIESLVGTPASTFSAPGTSSLITAAAVSGEIRARRWACRRPHVRLQKVVGVREYAVDCLKSAGNYAAERDVDCSQSFRQESTAGTRQLSVDLLGQNEGAQQQHQCQQDSTGDGSIGISACRRLSLHLSID